MNFEMVLCEIAGPVATVKLNRPKVLNALNAQLFDELEDVFTALAADGGDGWGASRDELQLAHGCEEGSAAADGVLPAFAGLEAEAVEEAA